MNKLNSNGTRSSEEFHYMFDTSGALYAAAFAQTPLTGQTGYTTNEPAAERCLALYNHDPAGRILSATDWWETWNGSTFTQTPILDDECAYETTGLMRGLRTSSRFLSGSCSSWVQSRLESYGYDPSLDYLTSATNDGVTGNNPTWSYDAAGNRGDTVADNLNRPVTINGVSSTSDILGNRLTFGSQSYGWDCLNRMTSYGTSNSYAYRADGMRVSKVAGSTSTVYRYDGQMGIEDVDTTSGISTIDDYGLGLRGIDYISSTHSGTTTIGFPIYYAQGNMTACLFRNGARFTLGNQRSYDVWRQVEQGSTTGDPTGT